MIPYDLSQDYKICSEKDWTFHTARINCCAWSANSRYIATGSLDTNIIVWDLQNSGEHPIIIKGYFFEFSTIYTAVFKTNFLIIMSYF